MDWPYELQIGWRYTGPAVRAAEPFISFISAASMAASPSASRADHRPVGDERLPEGGARPHALGGLARRGRRAARSRAGRLEDDRGGGARHPQVDGLAPFVAAEALIARGDEMRGIVVRGILPADERGVTELARTAKDVLARLTPDSSNVVLGVELARALLPSRKATR